MTDLKKCDNPYPCGNTYPLSERGTYVLEKDQDHWDLCSAKCLAQLAESMAGDMPVVIVVSPEQVRAAKTQVRVMERRGETVAPAIRSIAEADTL